MSEDNAWREGAGETIDLLTPAIIVLQEALRLARRRRTDTKSGDAAPDGEASGLLFKPAEQLIHQSCVEYTRAYLEARRTVDNAGNPVPYDADRTRAQSIFHLLVLQL